MSVIALLKKATLLVDQLAQVGPSSPAELAKLLDEPRPSVYRLIESLERADYVRATSDGRYELGVMILRLGDAAVAALVDRDGLHEQLGWVRGQLNMSAFFCVLRDEGVTCLDRVDGTDVDLLYLTPGRMLPMHGGAVSEVFFGGEGLDLEVGVGKHLAFDDGGLADGVATVAVPVHAPDGSLVGAVAVAGLSGNVAGRRESARGVLLQAADEIAKLGVTVESAERDAASPSDVELRAATADARSSSVIAKASALLLELEARKLVTSARLAEDLGEPVSSVYRMLGTLVEAGWVEQAGPRGVYRVGVKMLGLAESLWRRLDIRQLSVPIMREIHGQTGETTFLCIRHGARAVCIERIDGIRINSRVLQLGKSLPLHTGAAPRALLAFAGVKEWEDYASALGEGEGVWRGPSSRAELFLELEDAVNQGFVVSDNNVTPGIAAVGAPVFDHRGSVVASLSVSGLRERVLADPGDGTSIVELVCEGAERLSVALGAPIVLTKETVSGVS